MRQQRMRTSSSNWLWLTMISAMLLPACTSAPPVPHPPPQSLPTLPPLSAELSKPRQPCFLSAIESYFSGSGTKLIELCLNETAVLPGTTMPAKQ